VPPQRPGRWPPRSRQPGYGPNVSVLAAPGNRHWRREVVAPPVLVGDVLDEQHEQDVVLVLAGIHAAAEFVAGGPERGVEIGFLEGHRGALDKGPLAPAGGGREAQAYRDHDQNRIGFAEARKKGLIERFLYWKSEKARSFLLPRGRVPCDPALRTAECRLAGFSIVITLKGNSFHSGSPPSWSAAR